MWSMGFWRICWKIYLNVNWVKKYAITGLHWTNRYPQQILKPTLDPSTFTPTSQHPITTNTHPNPPWVSYTHSLSFKTHLDPSTPHPNRSTSNPTHQHLPPILQHPIPNPSIPNPNHERPPPILQRPPKPINTTPNTSTPAPTTQHPAQPINAHLNPSTAKPSPSTPKFSHTQANPSNPNI